ncbi:MAG: acid phosphatase type 7 [Gaiellales bacterium]|nr:acid phosphatase type 7 [Gaiellales bacterium]
MRALRGLLIVDALAIAASATISDQIVADVLLLPALLIGVLLAIASLSGELVRPRRRIAVVCSALTIVAPFPFLLLGGWPGTVLAATAIIALQLIPLVVRDRVSSEAAVSTGGPRRLLAALMLSTMLLLITVVALVWYGSTYLLQAPTSAFTRSPYLTRVTLTEADFAWKLKGGSNAVDVALLAPDGSGVHASTGRFRNLRPGTRYTWTANIDGHSAAAGAFSTAPATNSVPITLVSFGDYGSGSPHEYAVGRLAAATGPSLFLSSGDNAYLVAAPPLLDRAIFDPLRGLLGEAPMVAALGEHDLAWNNGSAVIGALHLPGHHYTVQYGPVQVVVLGLQADSSGLAYATRMLGRCSRPCPVRFVLTHRVIEAANPIMPLLRSRHVAAALASHLHRYERHVRAGVLEFTVGTGGEGPGGAAFTRRTPDALFSSLAYGFLRISIAGRGVRYAFVDERGRVLDGVSQRIGGAACPCP